MNDLPDVLQQWIPFLQSLLAAVAIFIVGWMLSKWAHAFSLRVMRRRGLDEAMGRFLATVARYVVLALTVVAALGQAGVETTSLVAALASAGLAVGLALQGSLSNLASGVLLLVLRPFDLEDLIEADGHTGVVKDIGLFATTLHTPLNQKVVIPNSAVVSGCIVNQLTLETRRLVVPVGVAYGSDVHQVVSVLKAGVVRGDRLQATPAPDVLFLGLGASSLDFEVRVSCPSATYWDALHDAHKNIYDALNEAGIEIPFNQIVVHQATADG